MRGRTPSRWFSGPVRQIDPSRALQVPLAVSERIVLLPVGEGTGARGRRPPVAVQMTLPSPGRRAGAGPGHPASGPSPTRVRGLEGIRRIEEGPFGIGAMP